MSFGPEELERRKQQRQQYEQKRRAEQQALKKRLIFAGIAIAATAVIILLAVLAATNRPEPPAQDTTPSATGTLPAETEAPDGKTVIHFTAAGDLNISDKVVQSGGANLDYTDMIADVLPILAEADLATINFEGNFVGPPYGTATSSAPLQLLQALKKSGVDMIQMANSRAINNGISGLDTTLKSIRASGIEPLGAYSTNAEAEKHGGYTIWNARGVRVAVVAFTKGMDNMALPVGSEKCVNLLYNDYSSRYVDVNTEAITNILNRVEKEKPDVTIVLLHWGSEFNDTRSTSQNKIRDLLQELGADVIIGTHPHYVQPIEYSESAGTLVAYSLGDFVSDADRMGTEYGIILNVEITKDNATGETKVTGYEYIPTYSYEDEDGMMRVLRIDPAIFAYEFNYLDKVTKEVYEDLKNAKSRIEARVKP